MTVQADSERVVPGYLPQDRPPFPALVSLGFQHVLTMFPSTVLAAILTSFDVGVTLFAAGLATIVAILLSGGRIPLWYGASFGYIAPVVAVVTAQGGGQEGVRLAQGGIIATAIINVLMGLLVRGVGKALIDKVLPPIVTGSVAIIIGISLAATTMNLASGRCCLKDANGTAITSDKWWSVALVTLLSTIIFAVFLRGRGWLGLLPVLFGAITGYLVSLPLGLVDFSKVDQTAWLQLPNFTLPLFSWQAILSIAPVALITIPEATAHLYQISVYVDRLAEEQKRPPVNIKRLLGLNLVLDGVADAFSGLIGGCGGTSYGENNSLMAITRNYSAPVLVVAGIIAMALGFIGKLTAFINTIPLAVTGGLAIYLFGAIGLQGVALMIEEKVNLFDTRQLAVGAVMLMVGIGGATAFPSGNIPIFGLELPPVVTAAVLGIVLNLIFLLFRPLVIHPRNEVAHIQGSVGD
jgi:uracil permease